MIAYFDRFSIQLTKEEALTGSHQGNCDEDVAYLLTIPRIARQLRNIGPDLIRAELKEYGAWDTVELIDSVENNARILWIACGNIREELGR